MRTTPHRPDRLPPSRRPHALISRIVGSASGGTGCFPVSPFPRERKSRVGISHGAGPRRPQACADGGTGPGVSHCAYPWRVDPTARYASVVFDCDSTLSDLEGIDALCDALPPEEAAQVARADRRRDERRGPAGRRLRATTRHRAAVRRRPASAWGAATWSGWCRARAEVVRTLLDRGVDVAIVSGGLAPAVRILARELGSPGTPCTRWTFASTTRAGTSTSTAPRPCGATRARSRCSRRCRARRSPLLFVGDGVTDLEAKDVVDLFVGYGGVVAREAVSTGRRRLRRRPRPRLRARTSCSARGLPRPSSGPGPRAR